VTPRLQHFRPGAMASLRPSRSSGTVSPQESAYQHSIPIPKTNRRMRSIPSSGRRLRRRRYIAKRELSPSSPIWPVRALAHLTSHAACCETVVSKRQDRKSPPLQLDCEEVTPTRLPARALRTLPMKIGHLWKVLSPPLRKPYPTRRASEHITLQSQSF
jgi:hypothetical protein